MENQNCYRHLEVMRIVHHCGLLYLSENKTSIHQILDQGIRRVYPLEFWPCATLEQYLVHFLLSDNANRSRHRDPHDANVSHH